MLHSNTTCITVYKQTLGGGGIFCKPRGVCFFRLFLQVAERKVSMNYKLEAQPTEPVSLT